MSQRAYAKAIVDRLREAFGWDASQCGVRGKLGKPPAACGEMFVAVCEMGWENQATESRDDQHRFNLVLTRRVSYAPDDRVPEDVIDEESIGLEVWSDRVAAALHADLKGAGSTAATNYSVLNRANNNLMKVAPKGSTVYGFCEPVRLLRGSAPETKDGDWFQGDPNDRSCGVALTLEFGKARRLQSWFLQT